MCILRERKWLIKFQRKDSVKSLDFRPVYGLVMARQDITLNNNLPFVTTNEYISVFVFLGVFFLFFFFPFSKLRESDVGDILLYTKFPFLLQVFNTLYKYYKY